MRYVEVHVRNRQPERHELLKDLVWVGSSASGRLCERELAGGRYEAELVPDAKGIRVETAPGSPLGLLVGGERVRSAVVRWGDEIELDDVRLAFVEQSSFPREGLWALGVLAAVGVSAALLFTDDAAGKAGKTEPTPPAFDEGRAQCSARGAGAEPRAFDAERLGLGRRERYAFDTQGAVQALPLLQEAAACFRDVGRLQDAQRAKTELAELRGRLETDLASLRLALRGALEADRPRDALRALRRVESLAGREPGAYREWLAATRRQLERQIAGAQKGATK